MVELVTPAARNAGKSVEGGEEGGTRAGWTVVKWVKSALAQAHIGTLTG